jgi:subtilisin family serine protease
VLLAVTAVSTSIAGPAPAEAVAAPSAVRATAPQRADAIRNDQWQLDEFDARAAWRVSTGKGVVVAVIDSGVDGSHPDLAGQVLPGIDLVQPSGGDGQTDPVGHGTTVAGLIAGHNDSRGIVGLAPTPRSSQYGCSTRRTGTTTRWSWPRVCGGPSTTARG